MPLVSFLTGKGGSFQFEYLEKILKTLLFEYLKKQIIKNVKKLSRCQGPMKYVKNSREVQDAKRLKVPGSAQGHIRLTAFEDS